MFVSANVYTELIIIRVIKTTTNSIKSNVKYYTQFQNNFPSSFYNNLQGLKM